MENAQKAVADGYGVVKMGLSKGPGTNDIDRVRQVAQGIVGKGQVMVDSADHGRAAWVVPALASRTACRRSTTT